MEINNSNLFNLIKDSMNNDGKFDRDELIAIKKEIASDNKVDSNEKAFIQALDNDESFIINNNSSSVQVNTNLPFLENDILDIEEGFVVFNNKTNELENVSQKDIQTYKYKEKIENLAKENPSKALELLQSVPKNSFKDLYFKLLDSDTRLILSRTQLTEKVIKDPSLEKIIFAVHDDNEWNKLLNSTDKNDIKLMVKALESYSPVGREKLLNKIFSKPEWGGASVIDKMKGEYKHFSPSLKSQILLLKEMSKSNDSLIRAKVGELSKTVLDILDYASPSKDQTGYNFTDKWGYRERYESKREKYQKLIDLEKSGASNNEIRQLSHEIHTGLDYKIGMDYTKRLSIVEDYLGENFRNYKGIESLKSEVRGIVSDLIKKDPYSFVEAQEKDSTYTKKELAITIKELVHSSESRQKLLETFNDLLKKVEDPKLTLDERKDSAYALGRLFGATASAIQVSDEPGILVDLLRKAASLIPVVGDGVSEGIGLADKEIRKSSDIKKLEGVIFNTIKVYQEKLESIDRSLNGELSKQGILYNEFDRAMSRFFKENFSGIQDLEIK